MGVPDDDDDDASLRTLSALADLAGWIATKLKILRRMIRSLTLLHSIVFKLWSNFHVSQVTRPRKHRLPFAAVCLFCVLNLKSHTVSFVFFVCCFFTHL